MIRQMNETVLLQFASGELKEAQESALLAQAEIEPALWRDLCLAVVEHRRIVAALGAWSTTAPPPRTGRPKVAIASLPRLALGIGALAVGILLGICGARLTAAYGPADVAAAPTPAPAQPVASPAETLAPKGTDKVPVSPAKELDIPASPTPADRLAEVLGAGPIVPESDEAVLREHGFQVQERPELYIIYARDGTQWAVPVQRAVLQYVKQ